LALLQETAVLLGVIPVAPYALPGSRELALGAAALCRAYNGCLLEHHGAVTWADSCQQAFMRMESLEFNADVYLRARAAGLVRPLPNAEIERLLALRPGWGVTGGGRPRGKEDYN
jgi:L-fuculose-phosphate aldolase